MLTLEQRIQILSIAAKVAADSPGGCDIIALAKDMERYILTRDAPPTYVPHSGNPIPYSVATSISLTEKTNGKS